MKERRNPGYSNTGVVNTQPPSPHLGELRILIDWLGFTFKADNISIRKVMKWFETFLNIPRTHFKAGRRYYQGYADSLVYENINIYYNGADNQGIHVDITGQGCRYMDHYFEMLQIQDEKAVSKDGHIHLHGWKELLTMLYYSEDMNITRLDIACDDLSGYINVETLFHKCLAGEFTMKFRSWRPDGKFNSDGETNGISLYFGSDKSDIQFTIYEKNKQLDLDYHWTRVELQFRRKQAEATVHKILNTDNPIGVIAAGILKNYLTFRVKTKDKNKARWPVAPWWENFLRNVPPLRIARALPDRSVVKTRDWVGGQVSRSLARLFFAFQGIDDDWMQEILKEGMEKLNDEDLRMIEEFRNIYGKGTGLIKKDLNRGTI